MNRCKHKIAIILLILISLKAIIITPIKTTPIHILFKLKWKHLRKVLSIFNPCSMYPNFLNYLSINNTWLLNVILILLKMYHTKANTTLNIKITPYPYETYTTNSRGHLLCINSRLTSSFSAFVKVGMENKTTNASNVRVAIFHII